MKRLQHWCIALMMTSLVSASVAQAQDDAPPPDLPPPDDGGNFDAGGDSGGPGAPVQLTPPSGKPEEGQPGADTVPPGQELVNIDFPEPTEIKDIIRAVALWTGKNVILGKGVSGKVQMISPRKVTKEEAYQAFLSALNVLQLTTVETGKVIKILPIPNAVKGNLQIYQGSSWAPRTDKMITQIVPLKYIDANQLQTTLSRIVTANSIIAYSPTNTLIISDTGYKVRRILAIIELLDVQGQQPQVAIVPIRYADAKSITDRVREILDATSKAKSGGAAGAARGGYLSYKVSVDERSNSVVIFGPPRTISDVKALVKKFDFPVDDPSNQAAIRVRFLDYADAKKMATTLSSLAQGGNNNRNSRARAITALPPLPGAPGMPMQNAESAPVASLGDNLKITADESSNALLITGNKGAYDSINSIIRKLDQRQPQIYIEADILDLKVQNGFNAGTSIFAGAGKADGTKTAIGWQGSQVAPIIAAQTQGKNPSQDTALKAVGALSQDFTVGILSGDKVNVPGLGEVSPGALITLLKKDANSRVLSSPHLLTTNNEKAKIVVGNTLFYETAADSSVVGVGAVKKVEKEKVDLTLEIKPNISHTGDYVTLKIDLEANEGQINSYKVPEVNRRSSSQLVTLKNGQTAVISGLVKTSEGETFQKIPLLGDIPILGWLFRNTALTKETTSLMIFITPTVVYGANDLAKIYDKKLKERDELFAYAYGDDYQESRFYKKLPNAEMGLAKGTDDNAGDRSNEEDHAKSKPTTGDDEANKRMDATVPSAGGGAPSSTGGDEASSGFDGDSGAVLQPPPGPLPPPGAPAVMPAPDGGDATFSPPPDNGGFDGGGGGDFGGGGSDFGE